MGAHRRLAFAPLEEHLRTALGQNHSRWARRLEVDRPNLLAFRAAGAVELSVGERFADILGLHPTEIWPDYYGVAPLPHGTERSYNEGCRCDDCRRATAEVVRARRRAKVSSPPVDWFTTASVSASSPLPCGDDAESLGAA